MTITVMALAAANTLGISVDIPTAVILSVLAAVSACGASGVAGGSLLLIPLGLLAVRHSERYRDASCRRWLHHRRYSGLLRDCLEFCFRRYVYRCF